MRDHGTAGKKEQALSAKESKAMKKEEKRKLKETKREQKAGKIGKNVKSTYYYCCYHNHTDRDPYGKLCIFRQCGRHGQHY